MVIVMSAVMLIALGFLFFLHCSCPARGAVCFAEVEFSRVDDGGDIHLAVVALDYLRGGVERLYDRDYLLFLPVVHQVCLVEQHHVAEFYLLYQQGVEVFLLLVLFVLVLVFIVVMVMVVIVVVVVGMLMLSFLHAVDFDGDMGPQYPAFCGGLRRDGHLRQTDGVQLREKRLPVGQELQQIVWLTALVEVLLLLRVVVVVEVLRVVEAASALLSPPLLRVPVFVRVGVLLVLRVVVEEPLLRVLVEVPPLLRVVAEPEVPVVLRVPVEAPPASDLVEVLRVACEICGRSTPGVHACTGAGAGVCGVRL